jgi:hypothetical protein
LGSIGVRSNVFGFNADFSLTAGSNKVDYTVGNSLNVSLGANSPTEFATGGYTFSQLVGNADFQELSIRSLSVLEQKLEGNNLKLERVKKSLMWEVVYNHFLDYNLLMH